jgi:hypothetical protein
LGAEKETKPRKKKEAKQEQTRRSKRTATTSGWTSLMTCGKDDDGEEEAEEADDDDDDDDDKEGRRYSLDQVSASGRDMADADEEELSMPPLRGAVAQVSSSGAHGEKRLARCISGRLKSRHRHGFSRLLLRAQLLCYRRFTA